MVASQLWVRDEQLSNGVGITDYPFTKYILDGLKNHVYTLMCLCTLELHTCSLRSTYTCAAGDFDKEIHFMFILMIKY